MFIIYFFNSVSSPEFYFSEMIKQIMNMIIIRQKPSIFFKPQIFVRLNVIFLCLKSMVPSAYATTTPLIIFHIYKHFSFIFLANILKC